MKNRRRRRKRKCSKGYPGNMGCAINNKYKVIVLIMHPVVRMSMENPTLDNIHRLSLQYSIEY